MVDLTNEDVPEYEIRVMQGDRPVVEAWSTSRLQFEPRGWQLAFRADLRRALRALQHVEEEVLHARYVSLEHARCDCENVLIYNVGPSYFSGSCQVGVRFERAFQEPPASPSGREFSHFASYTTNPTESGFQYWATGRILASWEDVPIGGSDFRQTRLKPERVWFSIRSTEVTIADISRSAPERFGMSLMIQLPDEAQFDPCLRVKPIFDGVLSGFHVHNGTEQEEVTRRLAKALKRQTSEVDRLLAEDVRAVLGKRQLVGLRRRGVQWNPADDRCVAAELLCKTSPDSSRTMSGSLFEVEPRI